MWSELTFFDQFVIIKVRNIRYVMVVNGGRPQVGFKIYKDVLSSWLNGSKF